MPCFQVSKCSLFGFNHYYFKGHGLYSSAVSYQIESIFYARLSPTKGQHTLEPKQSNTKQRWRILEACESLQEVIKRRAIHG